MNRASGKTTLHLEGERAWQLFGEWLESNHPSKIFVLVDDHTKRHCLPLLAGKLSLPVNAIQLPAGEFSKSLEGADVVWNALLEGGADRQTILINLGGGVITDLGGFIGATYMRGIRFVHIPTTLLAQVDASIGGKTGIDFRHGKNLIGTFTLPEVVLIDPSFLATLPEEEWRSGFAEIIKHALISDAVLFANLQGIQSIPELSAETILKAAAIKKVIVDLDPLEENERRVLNFGHSMGHALESLALANDTPFRHGDAVAAGMLLESWISITQLGLEANDFESIRMLITRHFQPLHPALFEFEALLPFLRMDKKNLAGELRMALISRIGSAQPSVHVESALVQDALLMYRSFYNP